MKKVTIIIIILITQSIFSQSQISSIREYLKANSYMPIIEVPLESTKLYIYAKESQKSQINSDYFLNGDVYLVNIDNDERIRSHVICELASSAVEVFTNNKEFIINPRSRSEIRGSREIIYYDERFNKFTIFISEWMFLSGFKIIDEYIVCSLGNHPKYKYLVINKYTGEEIPVDQLSTTLRSSYSLAIRNGNNWNLYDYHK